MCLNWDRTIMITLFVKSGVSKQQDSKTTVFFHGIVPLMNSKLKRKWTKHHNDVKWQKSRRKKMKQSTPFSCNTQKIPSELIIKNNLYLSNEWATIDHLSLIQTIFELERFYFTGKHIWSTVDETPRCLHINVVIPLSYKRQCFSSYTYVQSS